MLNHKLHFSAVTENKKINHNRSYSELETRTRLSTVWPSKYKEIQKLTCLDEEAGEEDSVSAAQKNGKEDEADDATDKKRTQTDPDKSKCCDKQERVVLW